MNYPAAELRSITIRNLIDLIPHEGEHIETSPVSPFIKGDYLLIPLW